MNALEELGSTNSKMKEINTEVVNPLMIAANAIDGYGIQPLKREFKMWNGDWNLEVLVHATQ